MVWSDYVAGTIAFLEHDRQALMCHRDALAAKKIANDLNLKMSNELLEEMGSASELRLVEMIPIQQPCSPP